MDAEASGGPRGERQTSVQEFLTRRTLQTGSISPSRTAAATASIRVRTRNFAQTFSRYESTVLGDKDKIVPMSGELFPRHTH
jgi:hypothetical protein